MKNFFNFKKLHRFFFYLLILFLPVQLGKHFWPAWSLVSGIRIDYLAPTVYLTDLLTIAVLVSWGVSKLNNFQIPIFNFQSIFKSQFSNKNAKRLILLFSFFIVNTFLAQNKQVAFLKLLKLAEFSLLVIYVKNNLTIGQFDNWTILLSITVIYSSIIAWAQFFCQSSIGGLLWWLGERTFTSATPSIAQVSLDGQLFLRPYATFPHPNVLGGYIAAVLPLLISKSQIPNSKQITNSKLQTNPKKILHILAMILGIPTLFITFSRAAWVVGGLAIILSGLLPFFQQPKRRLKERNYLLSIILLLLAVFLFIGRERLVSLKVEAESVRLRQELNRVALLMIKKHPLTGVGLNNFIPSLSQFKKGLEYKQLQPAHNIFLLIGAETGLVGLGMFLGLIFKAYKRLIFNFQFSIFKKIPHTKHQFGIWNLGFGHCLDQLGIRSIRNFFQGSSSPLFISLTSILLLGLVDHYFYTLQQTQLLAILIFSLSLIDRQRFKR